MHVLVMYSCIMGAKKDFLPGQLAFGGYHKGAITEIFTDEIVGYMEFASKLWMGRIGYRNSVFGCGLVLTRAK